MRAAKIIATLGPTLRSEEDIETLARAGADAFRLNLSYDTSETHDALVATVRTVEAKLDRPLCLIADLSGPRFRIGEFAETTVSLEIGQTFRLDQDDTPGDENRVCLPVPEAYTSAAIGDLLRLDDGRVLLRVTAVSPFALTCAVVAGTELSSRKIISLPNTAPQRDHLAEKDRAQITWAREAGVDWLSATWPTQTLIWEEIRANAGPMKLLAKMESRVSLNESDLAVESADGLVVARGDLGYDLPPEEIPGWQKRLVRTARRGGKPVVISAQMLESMVSSPAPTRAEASDVANAVRDGADALMLSAETAVGAYPKEAVELMSAVIERAEADQQNTVYTIDATPTIASTIAKSAAQAADDLAAPLIFCFTSSGSTALSVAQTRPKTRVVCASDNPQTLRQMRLIWGLSCQAAPGLKQWRDVVDTAVALAKTMDVPTGSPLVITAGMPFGASGSTNIMRITTAE